MASFLGLEKCTVCNEPKKSLNEDKICKECQEQIDREKNMCIKCGKVSKEPLNEDGVCMDCIKPLIEEPDNKQSMVKEPDDKLPIDNRLKNFTLLGIGLIVLVVAIYFALPYLAPEEKEIPVDKSEQSTKQKDTTPNNFSFIRKNDVGKNINIESNEISISGIDSPANIKISNGEYSIDGNSWTNDEGTISNDSKVKVKHMTSSNDDDIVSTELFIGGISGSFSSKTKLKIITPEQPSNNGGCTEYRRRLGLCGE